MLCFKFFMYRFDVKRLKKLLRDSTQKNYRLEEPRKFNAFAFLSNIQEQTVKRRTSKVVDIETISTISKTLEDDEISDVVPTQIPRPQGALHSV